MPESCSLCGEPVGPFDNVHYEVIGYERERSQGGTNMLRLRQRTGRKAHGQCVKRAQTVGTDQPDLFSSEIV